MFVDNFADFLTLATKFLKVQAPDIEVVTCESAKEALKKLDEEDFDIIVSDFQMRKMDGLEFLEIVRKSGNEIPFIIFTGKSREELVIQAVNLGATHYLRKGAEQKSQFAELVHLIHTAVNHRRSVIALQESEARYRSLFEDSSVSFWEEDFSGVKKFFDEKRAEGITDFREHFLNHPEDVKKCVKLVIITDVNKASMAMQGVQEKHELIGPLERVFSDDALDVFREELISLAHGNTEFKSDIQIVYNLKGRKQAFIFQITVPPDYENTLAKVYLTYIDVTERYESGLLVEKERKKAETYLELSSVMFLALDAKGIIDFVNSHTCSIMGYDEEELIGKDWFELAIPETIQSAVRSVFNDLMAGKLDQVDYYENPIITKSGDERVIAWHSTYLTDESGKVTGVLSSGEDVTEQRIAENRLRESEATLSATGQMAKVGGWELDAVTNELTWTEETHRIHEVPLDQKPPLEDAINFFHPDERERLSTAIQRALDHGEPYDMELRFITAKGKELWTRTICKPVVVNGKTLKLLGTFQDITENIAAITALEESEAKFRSITENSPAHIMLHTVEGKILFINRTVPDLTIDEVIGKSVLDYTPPKFQDIVIACFNRVYESGKPDIYYTEYEAKDGTIHYFEARVGPVFQDGKVVSLINSSFNITERKLIEQEREEMSKVLEHRVNERTKELEDAQEQLIRSERLAVLGKLGGGIGHELRNPLSAIKSSLYYLQMTLDNEKGDIKETLEILETEIARSERIINSLLLFAQPDSLSKEMININELVNSALLQIAIPEEIEVSTELESTLPSIHADQTQLNMVLINLCKNAVQAMTEGGTLTIKTMVSEPEWVSIQVSDTGGGITEENLHQLYEPLFTTKPKGIGIGLPLVKLLVEAHGGTIKVQTAVGEGTTFTVNIPLQYDD